MPKLTTSTSAAVLMSYASSMFACLINECLLTSDVDILIRPKRIYNFFLLHACFVCLCHVLDELSYIVDHIWTNLLTQCIPVPVPVFCCSCISGFPNT